MKRRPLDEGRRYSPQARAWSFVAWLVRHPWTRPVVLAVLGVVQMVLLVLVWQVIDLCILLMEVWAELAKKHLELTL